MNTIVTQDDTKPRAPPPPASTAVFPQYSTSGPSDYAIVTKLEPSQMQELFRFKRPLTEVSIQHLEALNLQLHLNTPLEELVSKGFLPPKEWEREPNVTEEEMSQPSSETLSNSMAIPSHEAFYLRNRELHYESQDVYDFLARKVTPGKESAKVTHFRKFWISLHKVGTYWDSSMDKYSEEATGANGVSGESSSAMDIDNKQAPSSTTAGATSSSNGQGATYTGRRYSTGSAMPISHRMDLICDFIDGVIWPFGGRQERSRFQTYMELGLAKVPVDWSSVIYRSPKDRIRNRAGMLEGPLFATSCRTDVGTTKGKIPEVLDILKEVGNVIYLAQHREREGKTEPVRGVGKWWAEKPRWGGGSGEAVGKPLEEDEKEDPAPTASSNGAPTIKRRSKEARMAQRKNMTLQGYQKPKPTWEKKVTYSKIGKPAEDEFDTVRTIPSVPGLDISLLSSADGSRLTLDHPRIVAYQPSIIRG